MTDAVLGANLMEHVELIFSGAAALSVVAHAVNTFPTPVNKYGAWLLGVVQFTVGQRVAAANTLKGLDTVATAVPKTPPANG